MGSSLEVVDLEICYFRFSGIYLRGSQPLLWLLLSTQGKNNLAAYFNCLFYLLTWHGGMKVQGQRLTQDEWYLDGGNRLLVEEKQGLQHMELEDSLWKILSIIR